LTVEETFHFQLRPIGHSPALVSNRRPVLYFRKVNSGAMPDTQRGGEMASDVEKIMDELEVALGAVLQASCDPADASPRLRDRLTKARASADKARAGRSSAENEYRAAVDRAFGTARQHFK
jgi:hypothetical protein